MNDWGVVLWFDHDDPVESEKRREWPRPDQDSYFVGPGRPKEETAAFGRELLAFLERAGVMLVQGKDDCTFDRKSNIKTKSGDKG